MRFIPSATRSRCTDAKVAYGLMAATRSGGRAVSGGIFLLRSVFNPKTLPLPAIRLKSIRQRKQATDGKLEEKERNSLQTKQNTGASSVSRSFFFLPEVHCSAIIGQTANCAPSRKSDCSLSVGGAIAVIQHPFDVGFTVEDFATQLDIGDTPLVAVVLKRPAAHLQPCRHLLIGEETLTAQCRAVVGGQMFYIVKQSVKAAHEVDYPLVVFVNQFVHITLDLVGLLLLYSAIRLSCL